MTFRQKITACSYFENLTLPNPTKLNYIVGKLSFDEMSFDDKTCFDNHL